MLRRPAYLAICSVLTLLIVFMIALLLYSDYTVALSTDEPLAIQVRSGETLSQLTHRLAADGTVRHPWWITALGVLRGDSGNIQAGEYVVQGRVSPGELLDYFVSGRARYVSFTVPEGLSMAEIAARLEARGLARAAPFLRLAHDARFIATLELPVSPQPPSLEGFLYPETYFFHRGVGEGRLIAAMVDEFKRQAARVLREQATNVGLSPYEVLILASIVEKETGVPGERRLVSAVFHNRLRERMPLATDPAVIYGVRDFDGNLTRVHLRTDTPYNTYLRRGLPPTPIANPGLASIMATVDPADVDYLFFVAKGDGTHVFTKDYKSHRRAVWKYQVQPHRKRDS